MGKKKFEKMLEDHKDDMFVSLINDEKEWFQAIREFIASKDSEVKEDE